MARTKTSWKKGQSPNPGGRPKRAWTWAEEYRKALERQSADGTPVYEGVSNSLIDKALQGDILAIKELANRMDGMPQQAVDVTSGGEKLKKLIEIDTK